MLTVEEKDYLSTLEGRTVAEKLYIIAHPIMYCPCGNMAVFENYKKGYRSYCSSKCANSDDLKKLRTVETYQRKYGVDNPQQNLEIKERTMRTKLEKFGSSGYNPIKTKETKLQRYGNAGFVNPEKAGKTKLAKYGDSTFNNREKASITCLEKYGNPTGYHKVRYSYKNLIFDSSWELAYFIFLEDHNIPFIYKPDPLKYLDKNKKRRYYPDFLVNGRYVEIKANYLIDNKGNLINHPSDLHNSNKILENLSAKQRCLRDNNVIILVKQELDNIIRYVKKNYGHAYLQAFREKREEKVNA